MDLVNAWRSRTKLFVSVFALLLAPNLLAAQSGPPALMTGLGQHHHVISTKTSEAQRFFDPCHGQLSEVIRLDEERAYRTSGIAVRTFLAVRVVVGYDLSGVTSVVSNDCFFTAQPHE